MDNRGRRLDDIVLLQDELLQALRVEGDVMGEAVEAIAGAAVETQANVAGNGKHGPGDGVMRLANGVRDMVDDDTKRAKVIRMVARAMDELGDLLYPYTREITRRPVGVDNRLEEPELWQLRMDVPMAMSGVTIGHLRTYAHDYVVDRVMKDMCEMFLPDRVAVYDARIQDTTTRIQAEKNRRTGPVRRSHTAY